MFSKGVVYVLKTFLLMNASVGSPVVLPQNTGHQNFSEQAKNEYNLECLEDGGMRSQGRVHTCHCCPVSQQKSGRQLPPHGLSH